MGMTFGPLHALFQEIYEDHFGAQDEIAERIKTIGGHASTALATTLAASALEECDGTISASEMVE